jgi:subtilisin family serine protease
VYISNGAFKDGSVSYGKLIGAPGTTATAVTVGSYDWNDMFNGRSIKDVCGAGASANLTIGGISCYSSIGYSRNGQIKPEVVAPGEIYYASYAKDYSSNPDGEGVNLGFYRKYDFIDSSGDFIHFNGTSAATPYVAGVIALMMQKNPALKWKEIRALFQKYAARDQFTTNLPNTKWGYGKLNMKAVEAMIAAIPTRR